MSQVVPAYQIINGFETRYFCSTCKDYVLQPYAFNSFPSLVSDFNTVNDFCPFCGAQVTADISGISRPFYNCAYNSVLPIRAWRPSDLSGLNLWLDATNSKFITTAGGNVTLWKDRSSYLINFTPYINVVPFNTDHLNFLASGRLRNTTLNSLNFLHTGSWSYFLVSLCNDLSLTQHWQGNCPDYNFSGYKFGTGNNRGLVTVYKSVVNAYPLVYNVPGKPFYLSTDKQLFSFYFDNSVNINDTCSEFFNNQVYKYNTYKRAECSVLNPSYYNAIGAPYHNATSQMFAGSIWEIIAYNRKLNNSERAKVNITS